MVCDLKSDIKYKEGALQNLRTQNSRALKRIVDTILNAKHVDLRGIVSKELDFQAEVDSHLKEFRIPYAQMKSKMAKMRKDTFNEVINNIFLTNYYFLIKFDANDDASIISVISLSNEGLIDGIYLNI